MHVTTHMRESAPTALSVETCRLGLPMQPADDTPSHRSIQAWCGQMPPTSNFNMPHTSHHHQGPRRFAAAARGRPLDQVDTSVFTHGVQSHLPCAASRKARLSMRHAHACCMPSNHWGACTPTHAMLVLLLTAPDSQLVVDQAVGL